MNTRITKIITYCALLFSLLGVMGCGDGKTCDCCTKKSDCEFGLKCVELIGGTGKVCGSAGINTCSEDACLSSNSKLLDDPSIVSHEDADGVYAVTESFMSIFEDEDIAAAGNRP